MARLSNSDLAKIPGYVFRDADKEETPSLEKMQAVARNCYLIIAVNTIWLLIPLLGFVGSNPLILIFEALVVGCAVLFVSNNYLAKRWYYYIDASKGSPYESHFTNIDNIGFRTFFVTLIGTLVFLSNAFKAIGPKIVAVLEIGLAALLIAMAAWIAKQVSKGLATNAKGQPFA